jgi:uncharacterized protein YbjT (DUF2867 family)/tryptophan-rich sensory protein
MRGPTILLTGATGYVGGRLLRELERRDHQVRCLARRPDFLRNRVGPAIQVVAGDVLDAQTLPAALEGILTAYYLVHAMASTGDFAEQDRRGASNFAEAAKAAGVRRIVYLGGLGRPEGNLSAHLRSRQEVGDILRSTGVPVVEFRASVVIGSGSLSFEMIRALVERLPVMITPRWVSVPTQPIYIGDVLQYLLAALDLDASENRVFEIGGADRVSYGDLMREYARQRRLRRWMIPVPVLTPRLSSLWLGLVTPVYARIGGKLIDGIRSATVVRDDQALRMFSIRPKGVREAIAGALRNEDREFAETRWSDALSSAALQRHWAGIRFGPRIVDAREIRVAAPPDKAFEPIERIGGRTGWYYGNGLWRLRGLIDLAAGGVGMRRGRRDPLRLQVGDTVDCWRVEAMEPNRLLRLAAEMKLPGRAWLEFEVTPDGAGSWIRQTAIFDPVGLGGRAYWLALYPLHQWVFAGMLRGIAAAAAEPLAPRQVRSGGWVSLVLLLAVVFGSAGVAGSSTSGSIANGWYSSLEKPVWTPPNWVFGPAWTVLYVMMAAAAWLVWRRRPWARVGPALGLFSLQLMLNILWTPLFFGLQRPGLALVDILLLWLAIAMTVVAFRRIRPLAGWMLVPYLLWVTFATALNLAIWRLNAS